MLSISVKSKRFNCDITLDHKVSVFIGDSGVGKTWFVNAIFNDILGCKVDYSESIIPVYLNKRELRNQLLGTYEDSLPLFIVDDNDFVFTKEFGETFNQVGKCYLILIVRTEVNINRLCLMNTISIDADSVYKFISNGVEHTTIPVNMKTDAKVADITSVDCVICEDSGSGYTFFANLFGQSKVFSSEGKDSIHDFLLTNHNLLRDKILLLIVDYSAIGLRLYAISTVATLLGIHVYIVPAYKSFEYMLLRSNMFKVSVDEIMKDVLLYPSLENKCEALLKEKTKGTIYSYNKSKDLKRCYYVSCCTMDRGRLSCDKGMSGNKYKALLEGTEFDCFLLFKVVE